MNANEEEIHRRLTELREAFSGQDLVGRLLQQRQDTSKVEEGVS